MQVPLGAPPLCGGLPSYSNSFPLMTPTQILRRLQQNERLPERSRQRLRLRECGLQGLVACLPEGAVSPQLCQGLYKLFLGAGTTWVGPRGRPGRGMTWIQETGQVGIRKVLVQEPRLSQQRGTVPLWGQSLRPFLTIFPDCLNLSDLLAVVQLSLQADLSVRLDICRQVSGK